MARRTGTAAAAPCAQGRTPALGPVLPASFYARPADEVAPDLLGKTLVTRSGACLRAGRIVETEAYVGEEDLACHASRGRTRRTATIYGPPGTAYVYLIYGMYDMFNVVAEVTGVPHAVLVRAVELWPPVAPGARGDGPGRLTRALGIDRSCDGASLLGPRIAVHDGRSPDRVVVTPRVGVGYAGAWAAAELRYFDAASDAVSRPAPGSIAAPGGSRPS